jgi:uncharacterized delta-60 repeat protein
MFCYYEDSLFSLMLKRGGNATGGLWSMPRRVNTGDIGVQAGKFSMEIVDGLPAVCFTGMFTNTLYYLRAKDPFGSEWSPVVTVDGWAAEPCMKIVDGHPAIAYRGSAGLCYRRASDTAGDAWDPRVTVQPLERQGQDAWSFISMQVVNGRPAISCLRDNTGRLVYIRAENSTGAAWGPLITLDTNRGGQFSSLAVINGKPAIGYVSVPNSSSQGCLTYVEATDSDGAAGAWRTPVFVDSLGDTGINVSLLEVNGAPALVYHEYYQGRLRYTRASNTASGLRWPPAPGLAGPQYVSPESGTTPLGKVAVGTSKAFNVSLVNPNSGSSDLLVQSVTLDGPNASEFSLLTPPSGVTLTLQNALPFKIQYSPVTNGMKSAVLHVTGSALDAPVSYAFNVTAESLPDLVVEQLAGTPVADGGTVIAPITLPGKESLVVITVKNTGFGRLELGGITIDGADAADFQIAVPPAPLVPPGGSTTFTLRHAPVTAGKKTAVLHLASNVAGDKNPYDLTVRSLPGRIDRVLSSLQPGPFENVQSLALQADGKILMGMATGELERLNPDGSPDTTFFTPTISFFPFPAELKCITALKDGNILIGGLFDRVSGAAREGLARLRNDGSLDESFVSAARAGVRCLALQPDGKILLGGDIVLTVDGMNYSGMARLNPDGTADTAFHPFFDSTVRCLALQPDGKILAGGSFTHVGTGTAYRIARLNPDGTRDAFAGGTAFNINSIAVQPDGKILAGGESGFVRMLPDGSSDGAMPSVDTVFDLALQADGKCIVAASKSNSGGLPPNLVARINADRSLDADFIPDLRGSSSRLVLRADGSVLAAGRFSSVPVGAAEFKLAALVNDPASSVLTVEDRVSVRWLRDGSAPELNTVTLDVKPAGFVTWTPLGAAVRTAGGWELTGLTLPTAGSLRVQGYAGNSVIEATVPLLGSPPDAFEAWRLQFFGVPTSTGDAADNADPDHDGLTNLVEFAFGLSPVDRLSNSLPSFVRSGNTFTATFTVPPGTEELIHQAEWSATLLPNSWTAIPDTGTGNTRVFTVPATLPRIFTRFVVGKR